MTDVTFQGQAGPSVIQDGVDAPIRLGRSGEQIVQELHGRFYEANVRGNVYSDTLQLLAINNVSYTVATNTAAMTAIIGVYNPGNATVNAVVMYATLTVVMTALQATGPGGFMWMGSTGNNNVSTGTRGMKRSNFGTAVGQQTGSQAKGMANGSPTGLTNNVFNVHASSMGGGSAENIANLGTAAGMQTQQVASLEVFDGSIIVPPGGIFVLLANGTPVAHSASGTIVWEEVPI